MLTVFREADATDVLLGQSAWFELYKLRAGSTYWVDGDVKFRGKEEHSEDFVEAAEAAGIYLAVIQSRGL